MFIASIDIVFFCDCKSGHKTISRTDISEALQNFIVISWFLLKVTGLLIIERTKNLNEFFFKIVLQFLK